MKYSSLFGLAVASFLYVSPAQAQEASDQVGDNIAPYPWSGLYPRCASLKIRFNDRGNFMTDLLVRLKNDPRYLRNSDESRLLRRVAVDRLKSGADLQERVLLVLNGAEEKLIEKGYDRGPCHKEGLKMTSVPKYILDEEPSNP